MAAAAAGGNRRQPAAASGVSVDGISGMARGINIWRRAVRRYHPSYCGLEWRDESEMAA